MDSRIAAEPSDRQARGPRALPDRPSPHARLANRLDIERSCVLDREAQLAALRVALGLPRVLPSQREAA